MCATNWPVAQAGLGSIQTPTLPFHLCLRPCSARPPLHLPLPLPCDGSRGLAGTAEFTPGFSSGPQHPRVDHGFSLTTSCSNNLQLQFTDLAGAVPGCPNCLFTPPRSSVFSPVTLAAANVLAWSWLNIAEGSCQPCGPSPLLLTQISRLNP